MPQTQYGDADGNLKFGYVGAPFDDSPHNDYTSLVNKDPQATQKSAITVSGVTASKKYIAVINGVSISYTAPATGQTIEKVVLGLQQAIIDEPALNGRLLTSATSTVLNLESAQDGYVFTITEDDAELAVATSQSAAEALPVKFGRMVAKSGKRQGRLVKASDFSGAIATFDITASNSQDYLFDVLLDGLTYRVAFTSDADATTAEISAGLKAALDAYALDIVATEPADQLVLTGGTGANFEIRGINTGDLALTFVAGSSPKVLCLAARTDSYDQSQGTGDEYPPNSTMAGAREGRFIASVESAVSDVDNDVYMRVEANGDLDDIGGLRDSPDDGCVNITSRYGVIWFQAVDSSIAVIQLP